MGSSSSRANRDIDDVVAAHLPKDSLVARWVRANRAGNDAERGKIEALMAAGSVAFLLPPRECDDEGTCLRKASLNYSVLSKAALMNEVELERPACRTFTELTVDGPVCWTSRAIAFMFELVKADKAGLVSPVSKRPFHHTAYQMVYALLETESFFSGERLQVALEVERRNAKRRLRKGIKSAIKFVVCTAAHTCGLPVKMDIEPIALTKSFDSQEFRGGAPGVTVTSKMVEQLEELTDPDVSSVPEEDVLEALSPGTVSTVSRQYTEEVREIKRLLAETRDLVLRAPPHECTLPKDVWVRHVW